MTTIQPLLSLLWVKLSNRAGLFVSACDQANFGLLWDLRRYLLSELQSSVCRYDLKPHQCQLMNREFQTTEPMYSG